MGIEFVTDENFIYLKGTNYSTKEQIKTELSGVWTKKGWRFPLNVQAARELVKFFPELRTNVEFVELGNELFNQIEALKRIKEAQRFDPIFDGLRQYQAEDASYLAYKGSALVLNQQRTGKTPTIIKTIIALRAENSIVICPSSLTYNWLNEFKKWSGDELQVFVYAGTPKQRTTTLEQYRKSTHHKVLIVSKDLFKRTVVLQEMKFAVGIVDEAAYLRNYKSAQSKAIFNLKAETKYALTGTPSVNHSVDVYGLLHFINPKAFPSYWQFADRYWVINDDMWGKSIGEPKTYRQQEMLDLLEINSVQRKRKDIMKWLPDVNKETIYVKMDSKQQKLYNQMLDTFEAQYEDTAIDTPNILSQMMRLRQLCLEPRLLGFDKVIGAKTTALLDFAEANDEPFIVMTTFSSYFDIVKPELEKLGKKVGVIDGKVSQSRKFQVAESFQNGGYDILLCNIIAAGTGFTLDRADTIIFLDKDFNPANNEQAQDRIIPTTKDRLHNINIISLVVADSMDKRIDEILENKEDLTKLINRRELLV